MGTAIKNFQETVRRTKDTRFNSARRMRLNHAFSNVVTPFLSVYIIAINLLVFLPQFKDIQIELTVITIILSVLTLVLSLLIQNKHFDEKEKNYHTCGEKLNELYDEAEIVKLTYADNPEKLAELYKEYHGILNEQNLNHSELDYKKALGQNKWFYKFLWGVCSIWFLCLLAIILPPISVVLFLFVK